MTKLNETRKTVEGMLEELRNKINSFKFEELMEYLEKIPKTKNYSFLNQILLLMQNPDYELAMDIMTGRKIKDK